MLKIGIVGLPNVGKSTLFQAITKIKVDCSNYAFCTIDPNIGVVSVPDSRLDKLAQVLNPEKKIYAAVEFIDIAGLVEGAHKGEGLGNQFLSHIKEVDAVLYVLRDFKNENIINTRQSINPLEEKQVLDMEMGLKDLSLAEKRLEDLEKEVRSQDKETKKELEIFEKIRNILAKGELLSEHMWSENEEKKLRSCQFLTFKPKLYLINAKNEEINLEVKEYFEKSNLKYLTMDVLGELELLEFSREERESLGLKKDSGLNELIRKTYSLLDLITFFTIKSKETRAWSIKKGSTAPEAGGKIHNDFQERFIKAEVINWKDLIEVGGVHQAREKGLLRLEGKNYIVQDGDILEIKIGN